MFDVIVIDFDNPWGRETDYLVDPCNMQGHQPGDILECRNTSTTETVDGMLIVESGHLVVRVNPDTLKNSPTEIPFQKAASAEPCPVWTEVRGTPPNEYLMFHEGKPVLSNVIETPPGEGEDDGTQTGTVTEWSHDEGAPSVEESGRHWLLSDSDERQPAEDGQELPDSGSAGDEAGSPGVVGVKVRKQRTA